MRSSAAFLARSALLAWMLASGGAAAAHGVPEADLKAAFVFNFAVFTEWPRASLAENAPMQLCVDGASPMLAALSQLTNKLVNGHRITVRPATPPLRSCHVLYLDRSDRARWHALKQELAGAAVLTVADDGAIGADGAVIAVALEDRRLGFHVDLAAARAAGLTLSSKLLRLARSVE